jgi:hypothetical protein
MRKTPRYTHDCDQCRFIGRLIQYDLWICHEDDPVSNSLIARYSSEPSHYASMADFDQRTQRTIQQEIGGLTPDQVIVLATIRLMPSLILNAFTPAKLYEVQR